MFFVPSWWYGAYSIGEPTTTVSGPLSRHRITAAESRS